MVQSNFINFPGIVNPIHGIGTQTVGARPDKFIAYCQLQNGSPDTSGLSTLQFSFAGSTITWFNVLCDKGVKQITTHGHMQIYELLDRRWSWKRAFYTRAYNVRQSDGTIDTVTQATIPQIVTDLFGQIGDTVDVSDITSTEFPEIVYDHDNVVDAIEELLGSRGYVISPSMTTPVTKIWRKGNGLTIPNNGDLVSVNMSTNPPEIPEFLSCFCGKTYVQSKLKCDAIGQDLDGSIKSVDDLSYKPAGGWDGTDIDSMGMITDPVAQQLALKTVGRWYQVSTQADGTYDLNFGGIDYCPGEIVVTSAWQYLPIQPVLLASNTDVFGKEKYDEPSVEGTFYQSVAQANPPLQQNTPDFTKVDQRKYRIDPERGIVQFNDVTLKMNLATNKLTFADVYLNCAYSVHDLNTFVKDRYFNTTNLGGIGLDLFKKEELNRQIIVAYTDGTPTVSGITDNTAVIDDELQQYLMAAAFQYQTQDGLVAIYRGLYAFATDGVNLQVRWDIAAKTDVPFATYITQFYEGLPLLPTRGERNLIRQANMADDATSQRVSRYKAVMQNNYLRGVP